MTVCTFARRLMIGAAQRVALAAIVAGTALSGAAATDYRKESPEARNQRLSWWREARFGMFIHWGLYAVPAGEWKGKKTRGTGEWIMNRGKIPLTEYRSLVKRFNPVKYDPREWVRIAKDAGMRYLVITSKHHDGFCLWDSAYTDYDVMSTPYGKDLLKPLAEACREADIVPCFYHSIMDWQHPNYVPLPGWDKQRPGHQPDYDAYVAYMKHQLRELVEGYGPLGVLWFDGEWESTWTHERGVDLYNYVRGLQPSILVNNRVDKGRRGMQGMSKSAEFAGDFGTPEQQIPAKGLPGVDWESCMTMNNTWGYRADDHHWKSSSDLIRKLIDIASKGGNFLLNVGPTAEGEIPAPSVERLAAIGRWMKVNGEAIYGTTASPFGSVPFGRVTAKPGMLYLHVFDWPKDGILELPGMANPVTHAALLAQPRGEPLATSNPAPGLLRIRVPAAAPDPVASVIAVSYTGSLEAVPYQARVRADAKGVFSLRADSAESTGGGPLKFEKEKNCLGFWTSAGDAAVWHIDVAKPGTYRVVLLSACPTDHGGTGYEIVVGEQRLPGKVQETGSWERFESAEAGRVTLPKGSVSVTVRPTAKPTVDGVMNLRTLRLIPAD